MTQYHASTASLTTSMAEEQEKLPEFVICSKNSGHEELDGNSGAFWSNEFGWGAFETATRYPQVYTVAPPSLIEADAEWLSVDEAMARIATVRNPVDVVSAAAADRVYVLLTQGACVRRPTFDEAIKFVLAFPSFAGADKEAVRAMVQPKIIASEAAEQRNLQANTVPVQFESRWEEGVVTTRARLDLDTGVVFEIELSHDGDQYENLIGEYVLIGNREIGVELEPDNNYRLDVATLAAVRAEIEGRKVQSDSDSDAMRALSLRTQALALLQQAEAIDGLKPYVLTHVFEVNSAAYLSWSRSEPTEEMAVSVLDSAFEPDRGEWIAVEDSIKLEELTGLSRVMTSLDDDDHDSPTSGM